LTSEVYERAIARASRQPGGRLDPPVVLALDDEVANVCPVPLDRWTSVAGG
jgi:type IV secretion system protein VirD4